MKVDSLLADLAAQDIRLKVEDGKLGFDAPPGAFTDALKDRVRSLRAALLARLEHRAPNVAHDALASCLALAGRGRPPAWPLAQCSQESGSVVAPLSSGQERMWFLNRLEGRQGGYTEHLAFELTGPLDCAALEAALSAVSARHGALRTLFRDGPHGPEQVVAAPAPITLTVIDPAGGLDAALEAAAHRPVDLATDPHVSFTLFALAADRHVLSVSAHHAAWDGWSNGIFAADLATAYNAARAGLSPALAPLRRDIVDLARGQNDDSAALERLRRALDGFPTRLELPTDRPRAAIADGRGAAMSVRVEPHVVAALAGAGRRSGATPYMTVLAAWALLLSRISGMPRLLIGAPVAARENADEEAVIGYLSNTVAIPVDVGAASSFGALVAQIRDRVLEIMADQRVPFEKLVEAVAPPRSRATTPLVQAIFAMQPRAIAAPDLEGLSVAVLPRHNEAARYELILNLETTADGALEGPLTYATALFDRATIAGWAESLVDFLGQAPQLWDASLDRRPLVKPQDGFITPTERALAVIWGEILQTAPTSRDDDFFGLGGHSLLLMRVVNRINSSELGRIELADALGLTVLSAMAARIDGVAAPASGVEEHAANSAQEGMWLKRRDDPSSVTWSVPVLVKLPCHAEPEVVRTALERLAARHPSLRTTLVERGDAIIQRIAPPGPVDLSVHDGLDAAGRTALMRRELARPMDLEQGPLYRFHLFRNSDGSGTLFLIADHSVIDGWSVGVLHRDIEALVKAAASGGEDGLPALTTDPARIAAELFGDEARLANMRAYWQKNLDGMELGDPAAAGTRPPGAASRDRRTMVPFSDSALSALNSIAQIGGTTATVALLAAIGALLVRLKSDGRDVSLATPFAGRPEPEHADLVGCFVELLPLRLSGALDQPFAAHLAATRRALAGALANQTYPLRRIVQDVQQARGGEYSPLFDAVVVLEDTVPEVLDWFDPKVGAGKCDLGFVVGRLPHGGAVLTMDHDEWLYDEHDARALAARLECLLMDAAAHPHWAVGDLNMLPEAERRQLTETFSPAATAYARDVSLAELWREAAERHADRIALSGSDGASMSYAALDRRAETIAKALLSCGPVGPTVALAVERGFDAIAAIIGVWKAGAAYLPLDSKLPQAMAARLMSDAESRLILADAGGAQRLAGIAGATVLRLDSLPSGASEAAAPEPRNGGSPAYVMFTSGTTGTPKGVLVPHRGIARLALERDGLAFGPDDVVGQLAPLAFDASTLELWGALLNGASLHIVADEEMLDPQALGAALQRGGVTAMWLTAGLFNRVAEEAPGIFTGLRLLATGGEVLSPPHVRRVLDACPGLRLLNGYGPTENTCITTLHPITIADLDDAIPIGRPMANNRVFVVDERLNPVAVGVWGELVCAGDGVALGYAGRADLTAASFVTLPWGAQERVYRTGDIVRWRRDGIIEFLGRRDGQVKIRGHRIETTAIEAVLAECASVRDAIVLVTGEGADKALVACVAADAGYQETSWRRRLAEKLPIYMMPARFIVVPALPVNANGKRDRRALLQLVADTAPASARPADPASNDAERLMLRLFAELFPGTAIDRHSNFLHLGGHSLTAMRLSARLEEEAGLRITMRALFAAATVAGIAALLPGAERKAASAPALPVVTRLEPSAEGFPLSTGQERLWVMQQLFPESGVYNVPVTFDMDGKLDKAALSRALVALEERHHALRLRVVDGGNGRLRQTLSAAGGLTPTLVDLTGEADPVAAAADRLAAELARPFRLTGEAGARAILMQLGAARWQLLLVLHHAIVDGWSTGILLRDLAAFYAHALDGSIPLPAGPAVQFQDVAAWQRRLADSAEGKQLLARWTEKLIPLPEPLALPTDHRRPPVRSFRGDTVSFAFDAERSAALDRFGRAESSTPFAVVTALVQALLHRLTGQTDLALGTLVAGRDRSEVQDVIGFFVNTLVLRQNVDSSVGFRRLLTDTRATCLQAVADQHCPFEALVEAAGAPRDLGRNPLFDVLVVWQSEEGAPPVLPGLTTSVVPIKFPFAKFDLGFHFGRQGDRILCQIEYSADLFEPETVAALFARLDMLAAAILAEPDCALSALPILPKAERTLLVERFNATAMPLDTRRTIARPFQDRVAATPSAPALLWNGGAPLDYRSFAARAGAVARRLVAAGMRPGEIVAVCFPRSPDMMIAIHGILMAGGAYAPLGVDQPAARISGMLEDLGRPLVLAAPECREVAEAAGARVLELGEGEAEPLDLGSPDGLAYVLFTSGSTGRPKGVAVEQHSVLNRILWMQSAFPIGPGDVILQKTPVTFDVSVWELFWWSWTGAALSLPPQGAERDPQILVDLIERDGVTVLHFVPSMLAAFLACLEDGRADSARLKRLRYVFASGEALDPALVERFDRLLHRPFGTQLHNLYGPTEATVDVTWQPCSPWSGGDVVPIGRPIANTQVHILDEEGNPTPLGVAGEIHLGGPQVARCYVNQPELTREKFIPDPFAAGGRLYRSGDLGRWRRDGTVEYLGRMDHQVKVRGQRIEPGEIEHALQTHAAIERAVVVPVIVQGLTELHGYVVARGEINSAMLRAHLRDLVTEAMIPARFFRLDALPLTSSGKLDRKALNGTPLDRAAPAAAVERLSDVEAEIRAIWKDLLPDCDPALNDGFFEAGGNSLMVIRLHERLNARWPGVFNVADLFACATIAEQAKRVTPAAASPAKPVAITVPSIQAPAKPVTNGERAIAIIGMAVRLPGAEDLAGFWRDVSTGADRVRPLPAAREADARALIAALGLPAPERFREGGYLDDVMGFDPKRLRMSPADAALLDPEQRLFLDTALRALEDAGRGGAALDDARVGVFIGGVPGTSWRDALMRGAPANRVEQVFALNVASNIATRLSFLHNWRGPAALIDTACSASLAAIHAACGALRAGECDWALVGGAKTLLAPPEHGQRMTIDSSTGRTRAFAEGADGTGMGEGAVAFLLRPLAAALAEGDAIHGVILGSAVNQDGASSGMAAPNPAAQAEVIQSAARDAGVKLSSLSYMEAHGTGTALGDPIEIDGLTRAFAPESPKTGAVAIGSAKGNYGHLDGAAGALGLARAILCLTHDQAPPQPFFEAPNPRIDFASAPVSVPRILAPLADCGGPRRAGISSFGLSGINAHVVIQAPPPVVRTELASGWVVVGLSAPDADSLRTYAGAMVAAMRARPDWPLADLAHTLTDGREGLEARLAVWVRDRGDLMARLAVFAAAPHAVDGLVLTGIAARARHGEAVTALHDGEEAALAAAAAFIGGARLSWPAECLAGRVHLPAAPLARRRCAPDLTPAALPSTAAAGLLGRAAVTAQGRFHALDVHASGFWPVADHLLNDAPTLVGMAFPALLTEAMGGTLRLRDLRWIRPLRPAELEAGTVTLAIASDGAATIAGRTTDGNWQTFVKAVVVDDAAGELGMLDLGALAGCCAAPVDAPPFRRQNGIVTVSERWDCLERVASGQGEALVWLRNPGGESSLRLHPGLLDVASGLALDGPGMVPTGCAEIVVSGEICLDPMAHVTRRATSGGAEADVRLADRRTGRVFAALLGLQFTRLASARNVPDITPAVPQWQAAPLDAQDAGGPVIVIGEGPLAERVTAHLRKVGRLAAQSGSDFIDLALLVRLHEGDNPAIVFAPASGSDLGTRAAAAMRSVLGALRHPTRLLALGEGAFAVETQGPLDPFQALSYGVVAAATLEEPMLTARYIDCDGATQPADLLAELAVLERDPRAVAWRHGRRLIRRFEPSMAKAEDAVWPSSGCCVVSGGTGGLSVMLAETLAAGGRVSLALLSRGGMPAGDHPDVQRRRAALDDLRAGGLRVEIFACDVADPKALAATLDRIRSEMGPITAVMHNAGIPDGCFLTNSQSVAAYDAALTAKVTGAILLDELTAADPVEAFVLAGSLTGLAGAAGHAAYTGANAFLDAFAAGRHRRGKPVLSIDWCGIRDMGMAARLLGGRSVGVDAGAEDVGPLLRRALAAKAVQVALLDPSFMALMAEQPVVKVAAKPAPRKTGGARAIEAAVAAIWADVLGYDQVAPDDDFYALGGDSIAGMQIVEQIVADLGQSMTLADLFETATVSALAERLRGRAVQQRPQNQGLQPAPQRQFYPVAWEQLAVLRAEAAADMGTAYNLPNGLELPPNVDMARLRAAVDALIQRHEILRTRLIAAATEDGEPMMEILPAAPASYEMLDVPCDDEFLPALNATVRPFDLFSGVPMRIVLGSVGGQPRVILLDVHHALADAFTMDVLLADLRSLYAGTAGPAQAIQLKDYAWWSREGEGTAAPEEARGYWLNRFQGALPVLDLPADRPRPARHTWRAETVEFPIAWDIVSQLRSFAAARRTTPFAVVTAAWTLLLARYARTEDLVLAVPVNSREGAEMAAMTGMLVSLLPLRLSVNADDSVGDLIQRTHILHGEALRNRSYGLGRLLADLAPPASPDRALLSEVTLSYMNFADMGGQEGGDHGLKPFGLERSDGKCDLGLYVRDLPDQMVMAVEYYAEIFNRDRMERMARHMRTLLHALVTADPAVPAMSLPLIDAEETAWLAAAGQGATPPLPLERGLFGQFAHHAAATPHAVALEAAGLSLTYGELLRRAAGIAEHLRAMGVSPGDRIALQGERDGDAIVALLGIVAAGAVYVPLDPNYPDERVAWIVDDAGCRLMEAEALAGLTADSVPNPPAAGPAYVMYTSGSTGTPKGVVVTQEAVLRLALGGGDLAISAEDRVMQAGPLAFDASTFEIWGAWLNGARLCVASRDEVLDPDALAAALKRSGATVLWMTTGLFNRQVDVAPESFTGLRVVLTGGDTLSARHVAEAMRACPDVAFVNGYGPTENTTFTAIHRIAKADVQPGPVPIGRPIAHTHVSVVEPSGALAPTGVWGEILTGGLGLAEGYLNRPDLTAERFTGGLYRTGDLGRWRADGILEFGGRSDGQIKLRGYRIELEEIEQALNAHPAIAASAVLFLRDERGDGTIIACVQPLDAAPEASALRHWLGARLPAYMVPRRFVITMLPVTNNGKVDRARLAATLPPLAADDDDAAGVPPRDGTERLIADIFSEVFGRPVNDREANFLDLGGHSLLAIKVVNRVAQATDVRLPMRDFFTAPTIAGLAALVDGSGGAGDSIPAIPDAPAHAASHAQARLYLASRMEAGATGREGAAYNITFALPFAGEIDLDALREALRLLSLRHETLRTSFAEEDGRIVQRIAADCPPPLAVEDISDAADPRAESLRLARREAATPFDLSTAPLLRARAIRLSHDQGWLVLLVLHHIVGDGWSSRILLRELGELYRSAKAGISAGLPALPVAYRDFAAWQKSRDWTASAAHWRAELAGAPDIIVLPADRPAPELQSHRGDTVSRFLPADLAEGLALYARRRGTSMAALGLALFSGLLYRLTRQGDMVIGLGVAGRDRAEVEGLIGFFVNVLPLRIRIGQDTEFGPLVDQVHGTMMAAMDHRDYPFDLLVRAVSPRRMANRQPLINVIYEYQRFEDLDAGAGEEGVFGDGRPVDPSFGSALQDAIRTPTAKHDLLLFLTERRDGCELVLEFDTDLFDRATAESWLGYLEQFASMVVNHASKEAAE